jgi:hypothetical protein
MKVIELFSKVIDLLNLNQMRYKVLERDHFNLIGINILENNLRTYGMVVGKDTFQESRCIN